MLPLLYAVLVGLCFAQEPASAEGGDSFAWKLPRPVSPVRVECEDPVDLVVGQPLPDGLLDEQGLVRCYATVVPTSTLAHLLLVDAWAGQAWPRGARLQLELDWERERVEQLSAPLPLIQRPAMQRNLGRIETFVILGLALGVYAVLDTAIVE